MSSSVKYWVMASRPKTLLAAFVPVLIGSSAAYHDGSFHLPAAITALICATLIQVGTNFVNDLYDFYSGADDEHRLGPTRVISSGLISPESMKKGIVITFTVTFFLGLYLVYLSGWLILVVGIISILAGIAYTAGPYPLAYNGLGDLFVFLFFGLVGTIGTYYVQTASINYFVFLLSIPVGALITNILVINNFRDIEGDRKNGKKTLAVIFGNGFTKGEYIMFLAVSYSIPIILFSLMEESIYVLLPLLTFPIAVKLIKMMSLFKGKELNATLELTAKFSALFGILFAVGIMI